jgi:serine/threonine-protein kinase
MSDADAVSELLLHWEERFQQGETLSAEELCRDCPEHLEEVRRKLAVLLAVYRVLDLEETAPDTLGPATVSAAIPRVAGYDIVEVLGRGAMGVVYKARQVELNRLVALKMILAGVHAAPAERKRLRDEAQALARLRHAHVVQVYDFGESEGLPYFALEYVEGGTLAERWRGQAMPPREAAELLEKLARAVHAVHECGIVHRDLKPANVLLTADGEPKIADFGLAKQLDAGTDLTVSGAIVGTPQYMAPEQAQGRGKDIGPKSDVYALGAILYELLTGKPPFKGPTARDTLRRVLTDDPVPPRRLQRTIDRPLETICLKCLAKHPDRRYASAGELAGRLRLFLDGKPIPDRPMGWIERAWRTVRRHPAVSAFAVLLVAGFALLFAVNYLSDPARKLESLQRRLAKGERVTLIGDDVPPAWYRWRMGEAQAKASRFQDEPFLINSGGIALIELLPDPMCESYRFSAWVRHGDGSGDSSVGIYFGHSAHAVPKGEEHYFCVLSFADQGERKGKAVLTFRARGEQGLDVFTNIHDPTPLQAGLRGIPPEKESGPWRELVVIRTPQEIRAYCDGKQLTGLGGRMRALSPESARWQRQSTTRKRAESMELDPRFAPREHMGIYVNHGSASFRRVVVQPLTEETEP